MIAAQQDLSPSPTWYVRIHVDDHVPGYEEKAVNCESENTGRELTGSGLARTVATRSLGVLRSAGREAVVLGSVVVVPGSVVSLARRGYRPSMLRIMETVLKFQQNFPVSTYLEPRFKWLAEVSSE